jgi:serine/threonine-protein kinase RsbW
VALRRRGFTLIGSALHEVSEETETLLKRTALHSVEMLADSDGDGCCVDPPPETPPARISGAVAIDQILTTVIGKMTGLGFSDHDVFGMRLSLEEALVNAIKHGNRLDTESDVKTVWHVDDYSFRVRLSWAGEWRSVRVAWDVSAERAIVLVADDGDGFDPEAVANPTAAENLNRPCGRGLLLMRHLMTSVRFIDGGRGVILCRARHRAATTPHPRSD